MDYWVVLNWIVNCHKTSPHQTMTATQAKYLYLKNALLKRKKEVNKKNTMNFLFQ